MNDNVNQLFADAFQDPAHRPFTLNGGRPAALLVHGFPGTPAEMRPLAETLHTAGWTVQGLLLPGFGPEIERLAQQTVDDWVTAVTIALTTLQKRHHPVLLAGHSMGAALALQTAVSVSPDALLLMAPFWKLGNNWIATAWPLIRLLLPTFRPFRLMKPDFDDPEMRQGIHEFMPQADLDDPATRQAILEFSIPTRILDQVVQAGRRGYRQAAHLPPDLSALVVQGTDDELSPPARTRKLLQQLTGPIQYHEFPAPHNLPDPNQPGWPRLQQLVLRFAADLSPSTTQSR